MPNPPPPAGDAITGRVRMFCCDLKKGDRVDQVFLIEGSNFKQTRNGKFFIQLELRDRTGSIKAIRWEATQGLYEECGSDTFVRVSGRVEEFQQHLQIIVDVLEPLQAERVDLGDFLPHTSKDIPAMQAELRAIVSEVRSAPIRTLLFSFLDDPEVAAGLPRCPAGKALHHAYIGGLLEHVLSLANAARRIAPNYPILDPDLLVAGAVLHDIGKLREISFSRNFTYTDAGQLVGHIPIGITWVEEKAKEIPGFPLELLLRIQHIIASHHGLAEHGAVKPPMTAEAIAFHFLDDLDAKLSSLEGIRKAERLGGEADSRWSMWNPALGRRLFFPGSNGSAEG